MKVDESGRKWMKISAVLHASLMPLFAPQGGAHKRGAYRNGQQWRTMDNNEAQWTAMEINGHLSVVTTNSKLKH